MSTDWGKLLRLTAPALVGLATKGQHGAVLRGFMAEQERIEADRQQQQQAEEGRRTLGARTGLELLTRLQQETDPLRFEQLRGAITSQADALGVDPSLFASVPGPDGHAAKLQELTELLNGLRGYDLDALVEGGASLALKDGSRIPVADALRATRQYPIDGKGSPILPPAKADANASTDYGRFLARYAKERGKKVDDLTAAEELDARKTFNTVDDRTTSAAPSAGSFDAYLMQFAAERNKPVETLTTAERQRARKEWGQADDPARSATNALNALQSFQAEQTLAKAWTSAIAPVRTMAQQLTLMETGLNRFKAGDRNGGSQAVLVTFQKILDPSSVVRESEYARSPEGLSYLSRLQGFTDRLAKGGAGVPEADLAAMVETARQFVAGMQAYADSERLRIESNARAYRLNTQNIFGYMPGKATSGPPAAASSMPAATSAPTTSPGGGQRIGKYEVVSVSEK